MNEQQQLPKGYRLKRDACGRLFFVQKGGSTLRRANREPVHFGINERDQAIRFAWWHAGEQCPTTTN
jgi:hypothetical protein